jgi:uncharacterized protein YndB with AHSA1/START domain
VSGEVRIERVIAAPREQVFRAWTDPEVLRRWWGPGEFTTAFAEVDLRPGGEYLLVMQPPHGDPMHLAGTFREVVAPERLVYTWRWARGWPDYEVTEFAAPRALAFRATAGPVRPEGRYELEPAGDGTRVRFALECAPTGLARLMTPMVARTMRTEVRAIDRLPAAMGA